MSCCSHVAEKNYSGNLIEWIKSSRNPKTHNIHSELNLKIGAVFQDSIYSAPVSKSHYAKSKPHKTEI